ncbi:hypothetical protein SLS62_010570 [Diatrype stigma]|uniref:Uncharacterized protein n=1 Tax=Diatrype stigma TaxID=117547 RepID=A0AAN9U8W9_9PEZI
MSTQAQAQAQAQHHTKRRATTASPHLHDLHIWHQETNPSNDNDTRDKACDEHNGDSDSILKQPHEQSHKEASNSAETEPEPEPSPRPKPRSRGQTWSPPALPLTPIEKYLLKPDDELLPLPLLLPTGRRKVVGSRRVVFAPLTPPPPRVPSERLRRLSRGGPVAMTTASALSATGQRCSLQAVGATDNEGNDGNGAISKYPQKQQGDARGQEEGIHRDRSLLDHLIDAACIQCTQSAASPNSETNGGKTVDGNMDEKYSTARGLMSGPPKASKSRIPKWLGPAYIGLALIIFIQLFVLILGYNAIASEAAKRIRAAEHNGTHAVDTTLWGVSHTTTALPAEEQTKFPSAATTRTIVPILAIGRQAKKSIMEGAELTDPLKSRDDLERKSTVILTKTTFVTSHPTLASTVDNAASDTDTDLATTANLEPQPCTTSLTDSLASPSPSPSEAEDIATRTAAESPPPPSSEPSPSGDTIFCPFENRPDIYTLCATPGGGQQTDLPTAATRATTSSASGGLASRNPIARLRAAVVASFFSLWDPVLVLANRDDDDDDGANSYALGGEGRGGCGSSSSANLLLRWGSRDRGTATATVAEVTESEKKNRPLDANKEKDGKESHDDVEIQFGAGAEIEIEMARLKRNLDAARDLIRAQRQLLATQHAMLDEHRESLAEAVRLLKGLKETLRVSRV